MKAKTYGKKSKPVPGALFFNSSPLEEISKCSKSVPTERSQNIRKPLRLLQPRVRVLPPSQNDHDKHDQNRNISEIIVSPKETEEAKPLDEDFEAAFKHLSLNESEKVAKSKGKTLRKVSKPPLLQKRPATIGQCTRSYLSPILKCKNVSDCIEDFQSWTDERQGLLEIQKIGEGSFGEVYRASNLETVILKLMPLNAEKGRGSRSYTSIRSAANELQLLQRMQKVPGFVEFRGACVLHGSMPKQFVAMWNDYLASGQTVESKDPNNKSAYPANQLWLLIEMSDAGKNLNPGQFVPDGITTTEKEMPYLPIHHTWDIFWQIVKALAKAEVYAEFEHRDLHLGNICVRKTSHAAPMKKNVAPESSSPQFFGLHRTGVEVTLIDYSLSRASLGENDEVLFYDFQKDKNLLNGQGDYQYDIYRYMSDIVGDRSSRAFAPRTNILWLHYVLKMLLQATLESLPTSHDLMEAGPKKFEILRSLQCSICPKSLRSWTMESAGDLLDLGIQRQWFLPEDIVDL